MTDSLSLRGCTCGAADVWSCVCPPIPPVRNSSFFNPFNGKCIHGKNGARFMQGRLITPSCESCMRMLHEP